MDTIDPTVVNITTQPTTKEQLISYGLGLAFVAVSVVVTIGALAAVDKVQEVLHDRKVRKDTEDNPDTE